MLELIPFSENSVDRLIQWIPDPRFLLQWGGPAYLWPLTAEQLHKTLAQTKTNPLSHYMFEAFDSNNQQTIGHIELMRVDRENLSAHVGRVLVDPSIRGKGYGAQLMDKICKFGFRDLELSVLTLGVFDFNESAITCYRKTGFRITEVKTAIREYHHEKWNLVMMELQKQDWEPLD